MNELLTLYKPQGFTPFEIVEQLREKKPEYAKTKIGYAGRLDPLAHGVLLLMLGEANKEREKHIGLGKTYEFTVLFGLQTDSFDYLGILQDKEIGKLPKDLEEKIHAFTASNTGHLVQFYPPFSSKTINGVRLFELAKAKQLEGEPMPSRQIVIDDFTCLGIEKITSVDMQKTILENLAKIKGDFRQEEIIKQWKKFFKQYPDEIFTTAKFTLSCSSGTYVRSLANAMGEQFGCGAIAYAILRTRVGEYTLENAVRL